MASRDEKPKVPILPTNNDAIVVGAGLGGLSCALELARNGMKVCVLERHTVAGGYAHAFSRKGYHFDVSLQIVGSLADGQLLHSVLDAFGVYSKLKLKWRKTLFSADYPDFSITLPNDEAHILEELERQFPGNQTQLVDLFEYMRRMKYHSIAPWVDPYFDMPLDERLNTIHRSDSFNQVVERYVSDPQLIALLGQLWMYVGLPPSIGCATFSTGVFTSSFLDGAVHVVGGGAALVRAMLDRLQELGGTCVPRTPVQRIVVKNQEIIGVETADGTLVEAPVVVSNADPYQTFFELIQKDEVSKLYRFRLSHMESSVSLYTMYVGLDCLPEELGFPDGSFFFNHSLDHERAYEHAMAGDVERTDWCVTNYVGTEATHSPEGTGIVVFTEVTPVEDWLELEEEAYQEKKLRVREKLLSKYERRFPGLREHIVINELATPRTMFTNTRNHDGTVFGLAQTIEQSGSRRLRNRTPIKGLYLTGAWTWAGGGYEGAIMSGAQTASSVLGEFEAPRPAPPIRLDNLASVEIPTEKSETSTHVMPTMEAAEQDEHYRFAWPIVVYGDEMNSRGFADASAYVRYLDRGRLQAIETICGEAGVQSWLDEFVVNVYRIEAHTKTTARLGQRLEVKTGLRRISSHRAAFDQRIVNLTTGDVLCDGVVEVLFLNQDRKLVPVPESFPNIETDRGQLPTERREPVEFSDDSHFPFRAKFRVFYEDTDCQGITYHVSYLRFCERALFELTRTAWPELSMSAWMRRYRMNVDQLDIRYLKATTLGDWLEVRTGARQISSDRIVFDQRIVLSKTGQVVADAMTDVVCRDEREQAAPLPAQLVDAYFAALPPQAE